jgi:hypothetical protein
MPGELLTGVGAMNRISSLAEASTSRLTERLAPIAERAKAPSPTLWAGRQRVNWREQFDRGFLGAQLRMGSAVPLSKGEPADFFSRPLQLPIFK